MNNLASIVSYPSTYLYVDAHVFIRHTPQTKQGKRWHIKLTSYCACACACACPPILRQKVPTQPPSRAASLRLPGPGPMLMLPRGETMERSLLAMSFDYSTWSFVFVLPCCLIALVDPSGFVLMMLRRAAEWGPIAALVLSSEDWGPGTGDHTGDVLLSCLPSGRSALEQTRPWLST